MALEQMPVWLQGARARVTEPPLELVLAEAPGDQQSRAGVTQVVEAEVPGKTHLMYGLLKVPAYPVIAERGLTTPDEDEVVWGAVLKLLKQQGIKPVGKGHALMSVTKKSLTSS